MFPLAASASPPSNSGDWNMGSFCTSMTRPRALPSSHALLPRCLHLSLALRADLRYATLGCP